MEINIPELQRIEKKLDILIELLQDKSSSSEGSVHRQSKRLLNMSETSQYLGISKSLLYKMVSERRISFIKIGHRTFFYPEDLDMYIEKGRKKAIS